MYYPCNENKGVISFAVTAKLICAFVFAYADYMFSHEAAHIHLRGLHTEVVYFSIFGRCNSSILPGWGKNQCPQ